MRLFTRRRLLWTAAASAGIGFYTWRIEPHWVEVVERDLPIRNLPPSLLHKRFVQISDLHVSDAVDSDYLIGCLQRINRLKPDAVLITGDFMTCPDGAPIDEVIRVLGHLAPCPLGHFAILGNHDYGRAWQESDVADKLAARLASLGIRILRNEMVLVSGLQLIGIDDFWSPNFFPEKVLPAIDWSVASLTLSHNPDTLDLLIFSTVRGWVLSGHTHGGQCKPPFLPPPLIPVTNRRYTSGVFDIAPGRQLYINRGLGHLLRVRFNARPEITVFRLTRPDTA